MVSTVVRQNLPGCITLLSSQKLCMLLGVVFTTMLSGTSRCSVSRNSRTWVMCSLTMMLMLSALQRSKMRMSRSTMGSPLSSTSGLGFCTPSWASREPSPAAMIA